ncbi:MAG: hypothetical protein A2126_03890 [Candidatus Woykebacteria bacterium GWB1_45_5]|uniref:DUF1573 domain-containing protein n=2 Tax=Candidatus Woykeibacteriota TaxID=1817899 RepID=A0A1G1W4X1_9BACT|nr:MAG: hypothetical protein A2113_02370 [Candidatus Woykebacteria bacterium GWA1_44_8]OGY23622.1 MAG: hypothetical protein A2126_03890 [Candidatus Woykebacteria bacterium GWB1_45_5]
MKTAGVDKIFFIVFGIFLLVVIMTAVLFTFSSSGKTAGVTTYSATDKDKPKINIETADFDFGQVGVEETKVKEIKIKNEGTKPLEMTNFSTSCDCTFAQVVINGQESPKFSMHGSPAWKGTLEPGKEATLKAIYEPSIMPVKGKVGRVIYFKTNDPLSSDISIRFTAEVL